VQKNGLKGQEGTHKVAVSGKKKNRVKKLRKGSIRGEKRDHKPFQSGPSTFSALEGKKRGCTIISQGGVGCSGNSEEEAVGGEKKSLDKQTLEPKTINSHFI